MVLKRYHVPPFDEIPNEEWETRDVALWAARSVIEHEKICAIRWGVIVRLMWASLGGIGLILVTITSSYISNILSIILHLNK